MKKGAKRQVVSCPSCHTLRVTLGEEFFRCCGQNHVIRANLATQETVRAAEKIEDGLEVTV